MSEQGRACVCRADQRGREGWRLRTHVLCTYSACVVRAPKPRDRERARDPGGGGGPAATMAGRGWGAAAAAAVLAQREDKARHSGTETVWTEVG